MLKNLLLTILVLKTTTSMLEPGQAPIQYIPTQEQINAQIAEANLKKLIEDTYKIVLTDKIQEQHITNKTSSGEIISEEKGFVFKFTKNGGGMKNRMIKLLWSEVGEMDLEDVMELEGFKTQAGRIFGDRRVLV